MTAPAQFRRITAETEITVPCVLACRLSDGGLYARMANTMDDIAALGDDYCTHWLPIQWPEVRG